MDPINLIPCILSKLQVDQPLWTDVVVKRLELQEFSNTNILSNIYFIDLEYKSQDKRVKRELVLKLAVSPAPSITAIWDSEHEVMTALYSLGYTVPKVYSYSASLAQGLGASILMERIEGEPLVNLIKSSGDKEFDLYCDSYNEAVVRLHNLSNEGQIPILGRKNQFFTSGDPNPIKLFVNDYLRFASNLGYNTLSEVATCLIDASESLQIPLILGVTHGDMQTNNLIYANGELSAVIDWGFAKTADIRLDVYWNYMLNIFDFGLDRSTRMLKKYLKCQQRQITDGNFFIQLSCLRLLIGLAQLASSSKNYHSKVDKMLRAADIPWIQDVLEELLKRTLPPVDEEFRYELGIRLD